MSAKMLGKRLRALRNHCKLNQRVLAARAGVTQPYIVSIEKGRENPTFDVLERLARALKCKISELVE